MQTIRHLLVEGDGERSDVDLHGACIRHANQQISAHELLGGSIPIGDVAELGHNRGRTREVQLWKPASSSRFASSNEEAAKTSTIRRQSSSRW